MNIESTPIDAIKPYAKNAKKHPAKQVEQVANSIKAFGFNQPIVVDEEGVVIVGHGRLEAAKSLGMVEVPVLRVNLTEGQAKAYRLADNKLNESDWDMELVIEELKGLDQDMLDLTGFDKDLVIESSDKDDEIPELPIEPQSKLGDVYQLGDHTLMCGDSIDSDQVEILMDGKKANMMFTDPPYLMGFIGNVHGDGTKSFNAKHGAIKNDSMTVEQGQQFIGDFIRTSKMFVEGAFYVCFYRLGLHYVFNALAQNGIDYKAVIIWDKGNHTLSNSDYMSRYEPIVYGWFDEHKFYGGRSNFDIWRIDRTKKNDLHPTMKPVALCEQAIVNSSERNGIVLDLFGGSGSTLIACAKLGRIARVMELDPKYADVIVSRWVEYTGNPTIIRNGETIDWK
jgi:DNA modification methylase